VTEVATPRAWRRDPKLVSRLLQYAAQVCAESRSRIPRILGGRVGKDFDVQINPQIISYLQLAGREHPGAAPCTAIS